MGEHPIRQLQEVLSDPEAANKVSDDLARYEGVLRRLRELEGARDYVTTSCLKELAAYICDLCARLGAEYDPALGQLLLIEVGQRMAGDPEKHGRDTEESAPGRNAMKMRIARECGIL